MLNMFHKGEAMALLENKVALITGAASGIGREIALLYAEHGANIVVADIQAESREGKTPTHDLCEQKGVKARYVQCDVTRLQDLEGAVNAAEELGGVDIMVNNAGIFRQHNFLETSEDDFEQMMAINVKGVYFGAQAAAKRMVEKGSGVIINLSSVAGLQGSPGFSTYCASKGAVRLLTYALAGELGPHGVRVIALHPGLIATDMTTEDVPIIGTDTGEGYLAQIPLNRWGQPQDVAKTALYAASDLAEYVTGASLLIDGGMLRV